MKTKRTSKSKERSVPTKRPKRKKITTKKAARAEIDAGGLAAVVGQDGGKNRVERGKEGEGKGMIRAVIAGANEVTRKHQPMVQETIGPEATEIRSSTEVPINPSANAIEKTDSTQGKRALELVDRLSLWSGAAGFIPVPLVDIAAVWGVQLHMLRRLSEIYGVPFSENRGKSILTSLAGAVIPATTATAAGSAMKSVPIIGTAIGALTMPVVAAGATWVIGQVFIKHFASGGTLLDFNAPDYYEFIKTQKAKFAARSRMTPAAPA
jgi:uncharacterized protein (DUF697 family)